MSLFKLFDMHCDTPFEAYHKSEDIKSNSLAISIDKTKDFSKYIQVAAIWTDNTLSHDCAYGDFFKIRKDFEEKVNNCGSHIIKNAENLENGGFILAVEGLSLLDGDISRLFAIIDSGVKVILPVWKDISCIGGAYNTETGLTSFGEKAVKACFENGIIIDLSHASHKLFSDVARIAMGYKKPIAASHSNSYRVYPHQRNLTDSEFLQIKNSGGIVGISFSASHLGEKNVNIDTVCDHILHYLSLGGEDTVAFGCDFDGTKNLPIGIESISDMPKIAYALLQKGVSEKAVEKITFENAYNFMRKSL